MSIVLRKKRDISKETGHFLGEIGGFVRMAMDPAQAGFIAAALMWNTFHLFLLLCGAWDNSHHWSYLLHRQDHPDLHHHAHHIY